jgi:hypothetical protein
MPRVCLRESVRAYEGEAASRIASACKVSYMPWTKEGQIEMRNKAWARFELHKISCTLAKPRSISTRAKLYGSTCNDTRVAQNKYCQGSIFTGSDVFVVCSLVEAICNAQQHQKCKLKRPSFRPLERTFPRTEITGKIQQAIDL